MEVRSGKRNTMAQGDRDGARGHPHLLVSGWALERVLEHLQTNGAVGDSPQVRRPSGRLAHVWLGPDVDDEKTRQAINKLPAYLRARVYANEVLEVPGPATDRSVIAALPQDLVGRDAARPARALAARRSDSSDGAGVTIGVVDTGMWPHDWCAGASLAHVRDPELEDAPYDSVRVRGAGGEWKWAPYSNFGNWVDLAAEGG